MMLREAIFKGATRPAMKFGVPLVPLVTIFCAAMLAIMWGGLLVSWWIAPGVIAAAFAALAWMRFTTKKDDQRYRQLFLRTKLTLIHKNTLLWKCRSYSPYVYRGVSDAWRR